MLKVKLFPYVSIYSTQNLLDLPSFIYCYWNKRLSVSELDFCVLQSIESICEIEYFSYFQSHMKCGFCCLKNKRKELTIRCTRIEAAHTICSHIAADHILSIAFMYTNYFHIHTKRKKKILFCCAASSVFTYRPTLLLLFYSGAFNSVELSK